MTSYGQFVKCGADMESIVNPGLKELNMPILRNIIDKMLIREINSKKDMKKFIMEMQREFKISLSHPELLHAYRVVQSESGFEYDIKYEQLLQKNSFRSQSGVMVYTVVLSPKPNGQNFTCQWNCKYCPNQEGQPRSYVRGEPGVDRANGVNFDTFSQIRQRTIEYIATGHPIDKAEVIVLGGTWASFPQDYQEHVITQIYYGANTYPTNIKMDNVRSCGTLEQEIKVNETAILKIIGLTLETRPDCINPEELKRFRRFGVTRVQLGIQHINNDVLKRINRGCASRDSIRAIKMLKDSCFKVDVHWMPDLPQPYHNGIAPDKKTVTIDDINTDINMRDLDENMFRRVINGEEFQADQWKIYPAETMPDTELEKEYLAGLYKPYGENEVPNEYVYKKKRVTEETKLTVNGKKQKEPIWSELCELLVTVKSIVPLWIRLNRIVRDIPSEYIVGGIADHGSRQVIEAEMKRRGLKCNCIRCREVKKQNVDYNQAIFVHRTYQASRGTEHFLSYELSDGTLFGFLRLRLSDDAGEMVYVDENGNYSNKSSNIFPELNNTALIRELHVYGQTTIVGRLQQTTSAQHSGFGMRLMNEAFRIGKEAGFLRFAVISGVGVKEYYRKKFGFVDYDGNGYFLIKTFPKTPVIISLYPPAIESTTIKTILFVFDKYPPTIVPVVVATISLLFGIFAGLYVFSGNIV